MENDRKHLTSREVERLMEAIKGSRNAPRDLCLVLLMYRHGLRVSEACGLQLDQVDTESRQLHVKRLKGGLSTTHPLRGDELRAIQKTLYIVSYHSFLDAIYGLSAIINLVFDRSIGINPSFCLYSIEKLPDGD